MSQLKITRSILGLSLAVLGVLFLSTTAFAQAEQPSEISIQGIGLFTKSSEAGGIRQEATKSSGFLVGYSYKFNRWAGVEGNYGFSRNTQNYLATTGTTGIQSDVHEFTGAFVATFPVNSKVEPYALAGSGVLLFDPTTNNSFAGADRQGKAVFLYGGGVKFGLTHNIGIRGEYRGYVYKTPDFDVSGLNLDKITHLAQPSAGIYFRF